MKRIAITGVSGYLGGKLADALHQSEVQTLGIDVRRPAEPITDEFAELDICDEELVQVLTEFSPDTIIHAAFVVTPLRDQQAMRRINVEGTRNLLKSVESISPKRLMVLSSATAYGAWPDNPIPMEESWPVRARTEFPYAADKAEIEAMIEEYACRFPDIAISLVRPTIIGGPDMDNFLSRIMFGMPFLVKLDGYDQPMQFVHELDVVGAIKAILAADGRGAYNVAPPNWTHLSEIASETGRWAIRLPFWFVYLVYKVGWFLRLPYPETRPGFLYFARFPWVVRSKRLEEELGFTFQYSTEQTMQSILDARKGQTADGD
jgi:UDP-glucose 4-epimerase